MIAIIVATALNGAIGLNNQLIYHISADMKRFKALTTGNTVLMGRKTFQSLPKGALPNRRNIVLSRDPQKVFPGAETFQSLDQALKQCHDDEKVFIIGGAEIYHQAFNIADRIELTLVYDTPSQADAFFPEITDSEWQQLSQEDFPAGEQSAHPYSFITYIRR